MRDAADKRLGGGAVADEVEADHRRTAQSAGELSLGEGVVWMPGEPGIVNVAHARLLGEPLGDRAAAHAEARSARTANVYNPRSPSQQSNGPADKPHVAMTAGIVPLARAAAHAPAARRCGRS